MSVGNINNRRPRFFNNFFGDGQYNQSIAPENRKKERFEAFIPHLRVVGIHSFIPTEDCLVAYLQGSDWFFFRLGWHLPVPGQKFLVKGFQLLLYPGKEAPANERTNEA